MAVHGVDVASYQSSTYPTAGIDFVFVKATEGVSYINEKQVAQADRARKAGLVTGFYHFLRPGDMRAQARYFVEKCASLEGDPLWCDWEDPKVSCADKDLFLAEVKRLRGATHRVGLYCNLSFWTGRDTTSQCGDALWIADPSAPAGHPRVQHPWTVHQYSISGGMDRNVADFPTRAAMRAWAAGGSTPTPSEEDPMAGMSNEDIARAVWRTDGVFGVPPEWRGTNQGNDTWMPQSVLVTVGNIVRRVEAKVDAQAATIDKLVDALGTAGQFDPEQLKAEIRQAIESITVRLDAPE